MNYYNEHDPKAAAWLRELIKAGAIAPGEVDERSIVDVKPVELIGYVQCHFFAGIGGWSYALRLAGWPDDRPVWTGSCPCQPFSVAGVGAGNNDPRSLWWAFRWLIQNCNPSEVFGEQVAGKAGRAWLAGVRADLEALGYAVGGADLCAAGVSAPHIRQRLFWVAYSESLHISQGYSGHVSDGNEPGRIDTDQAGPITTTSCDSWNDYDLILCADGKTRRIKSGLMPLVNGIPGRVGLIRGYGNAIVPQIAAEFIKAYGDKILEKTEGWSEMSMQ